VSLISGDTLRITVTLSTSGVVETEQITAHSSDGSRTHEGGAAAAQYGADDI